MRKVLALRRMTMWLGLPRTTKNKKLVRTESRMDIDEILKMKLDTIKEEEPHQIAYKDSETLLKSRTSISKKLIKKFHLNIKVWKLFNSQLILKDSYVLFMTGFASKGSLTGFPRY